MSDVGVMYRCVIVQVKVSDVGLRQAVGCAADYYSSLLNSSLKSAVAWSVHLSPVLSFLHLLNQFFEITLNLFSLVIQSLFTSVMCPVSHVVPTHTGRTAV